ncbi:DUF2812 domain-containing protein, partial [Clostridium sp. AL.422]|uniref:DUF2812 domain-containing protein n=1 Tax=Clostridium TaxID=1485 RepID=UPI00293DAFF6
MRFGDINIILMDFYSYEIGALESYFEELALKGWMLEKVSRLYIKFKKMEPKQIKYTIDVVDGVLENGELDKELALEYREKLQDLGWNYSCEFNKLQVFYKENEDKKSSISKKGIQEIQCLFDNSLTILILRILSLTFILFTQISSIFRGRSIDYFVDNSGLLSSAIISIFIIVCIIDLFKLIKFKVINNEKRQSSLWIRFKRVILDIIFLTAGIGLITILFDDNKEDFSIKIIILSLIIGILLLCYF